jgi:hypothetical protein
VSKEILWVWILCYKRGLNNENVDDTSQSRPPASFCDSNEREFANQLS